MISARPSEAAPFRSKAQSHSATVRHRMFQRTTMTEALSRLEELLPSQAPKMWESLRPPVTDDDIESLRVAVAPCELASEYEQLRPRNESSARLHLRAIRAYTGHHNLIGSLSQRATRNRRPQAGADFRFRYRQLPPATCATATKRVPRHSGERASPTAPRAAAP